MDIIFATLVHPQRTYIKGAVSKCGSQENSPRQTLEKAVKIQLYRIFTAFLLGYFLENVILRQPLLQQYHFSESSENTSMPP